MAINVCVRNEKMLALILKPPPGPGTPKALSIEFAIEEIINAMIVSPTKESDCL